MLNRVKPRILILCTLIFVVVSGLVLFNQPSLAENTVTFGDINSNGDGDLTVTQIYNEEITETSQTTNDFETNTTVSTTQVSPSPNPKNEQTASENHLKAETIGLAAAVVVLLTALRKPVSKKLKKIRNKGG